MREIKLRPSARLRVSHRQPATGAGGHWVGVEGKARGLEGFDAAAAEPWVPGGADVHGLPPAAVTTREVCPR